MLLTKDKNPKVQKINNRIKYNIIAGHQGDNSNIESMNTEQL